MCIRAKDDRAAHVFNADSAEWIFRFALKRNRLALAKQGNAPDETYALQVWTIKLPKLDDKAFLSEVSKQLAADTPSNRFVPIEKRESLERGKHGSCVRFHNKVEDAGAVKRTNTPRRMVLETDGFTCRHPQNTEIFIHLAFSHRYYPEHYDDSLASKVEWLYDQLRFDNLSLSEQ